MDEWRRVRLEEVCREITVGHVGPMADKYTDEGVPFLRSLNVEPFRVKTDGLKFIGLEFHAELKKSALRPGDVLIVRTGKPGACAIVPDWLEDANCSDLVIARCGPRLRARFLPYVVNSVAGQHIANHLVGAVQQHFNVGSAREIEFGLPEVAEQDQIVELLGSLDDKIELNRRINQTLESMARAIFKDWFVDFGPTRAKVEGRDPYLAPELWDLFPEALDGENKPVGWSFDTLAKLAVTNSESWTARRHPPTIEYVDLSSAKWGNIEATTLLDWETAPSRARRIAKAGDTIMGTTRPGNGSFAYISRDGLTVSTGFAVLSPRKEMYRDTIFIAATSVENIERLANLADGHGGAYPAVKPKEVSDTVIVYPGDEVLALFTDLVSPIREKIEHANAESRTLAQTRDLLLPKLMSGETRLNNVREPLTGVA